MRGHSLPELLVALGVAALLAGLAVAGWAPLRSELRLRTAVGALQAAAAQGRQAALSRGETVQLCPSGDGRDCVAEGSAGGAWVLRSADGVWLAGAPLGAVRLTANRPALAWYPWPRAASPVTFRLCDAAGGRRSRQLIVSQAGRTRIERAGPC